MPEETLRRLLRRPPESNKYDFGHVLVVGGSPGLVGAPLLAGEAALRAGAGLVTIASQPEVIDKLEKRVREIMTLRLTSQDMAAELTDFIGRRKVSVMVIGPGLAPASAALTPALLLKLNIPVIVDAGALAAFAGQPDSLKKAARRNPGIVLTPHAGEFHKLTGVKPPADRQKLKKTAADFARTYGVTLIFKGRQTLVAHPDGRVYENPTGNPGLATAGTGDILAGVIAAFLAQLSDIDDAPARAAEAAVYLHGLAGDLAAKAKTQPGLIASDVIDQIPAALLSIRPRPTPD